MRMVWRGVGSANKRRGSVVRVKEMWVREREVLIVGRRGMFLLD